MKQLVLGIGTLVASSWLTTHAQAAIEFTPIACSTSAFTQVDWQYDQLAELPQDINCTGDWCAVYANNLQHWRTLYANKYVREIEFRATGYNLETNADWVDIWQNGGSAARLTGFYDVGASGFWFGVDTVTSLQRRPMQINFHTNQLNGYWGLPIQAVRVKCASTPTSYTNGEDPLTPAERVTGILLGTNDVVHFHMAAFPGTQRMNLALWTGAKGEVKSLDPDLYLRCNAQPTPTAYDYRVRSTGGGVISVPSSLCSGGTWYIAVHAYSGAGQFNLMVSPQMAKHHRTYAVGITKGMVQAQSGATTAEKTTKAQQTVKNALVLATRRFFGQTEAQVYLPRFDSYSGVNPARKAGEGREPCTCAGGYCDICFETASEAGQAVNQVFSGPYQPTFIQMVETRPETLAHEFGHAYLSLPDEYYDSTFTSGVFPRCGHSNMAAPSDGDIYYELENANNNNFCFAGDHGKDAYDPAYAMGGKSNWDIMFDAGHVPLRRTTTPDNYDFMNLSHLSPSVTFR